MVAEITAPGTTYGAESPVRGMKAGRGARLGAISGSGSVPAGLPVGSAMATRSRRSTMRTLTRSPMAVTPCTKTTKPPIRATPSVVGFFSEASDTTTSISAPATTGSPAAGTKAGRGARTGRIDSMTGRGPVPAGLPESSAKAMRSMRSTMRTLTRSPTVVAPLTATTRPPTLAMPSRPGFFSDSSAMTTSSSAPTTTGSPAGGTKAARGARAGRISGNGSVPAGLPVGSAKASRSRRSVMRTLTRSPRVGTPLTKTTRPPIRATPSVSGFLEDASAMITSISAPTTTGSPAAGTKAWRGAFGGRATSDRTLTRTASTTRSRTRVTSTMAVWPRRASGMKVARPPILAMPEERSSLSSSTNTL